VGREVVEGDAEGVLDFAGEAEGLEVGEDEVVGIGVAPSVGENDSHPLPNLIDLKVPENAPPEPMRLSS